MQGYDKWLPKCERSMILIKIYNIFFILRKDWYLLCSYKACVLVKAEQNSGFKMSRRDLFETYVSHWAKMLTSMLFSIYLIDIIEDCCRYDNEYSNPAHFLETECIEKKTESFWRQIVYVRILYFLLQMYHIACITISFILSFIRRSCYAPFIVCALWTE